MYLTTKLNAVVSLVTKVIDFNNFKEVKVNNETVVVDLIAACSSLGENQQSKLIYFDYTGMHPQKKSFDIEERFTVNNIQIFPKQI